VIDQEGRCRVGAHISDPPELVWLSPLRLCVDGLVQRLPEQDEADRHHGRLRTVGSREMAEASPSEVPPHGRADQADSEIIGQMPLLLREAEVRSLLTMDVTLAALESAFREWAAGRASNQPRRRVAAGASLAVMSAALPSSGLMGFKAYTVTRAGAHFWLTLFDLADGRPRAVIEASWLGAMRTGAASGLATRYLARPEASALALIGSGGQALTQVLAIAAVRPLREVRVYSRDPHHRAAFVDRLRPFLAHPTPGSGEKQSGEIAIQEATSAEKAVASADIITTITSAGEPVLRGSELAAGQHLNVCGSNFPHRREVDADAVRRANRLVADDVEAAGIEAGDLLLAEKEGRLDWRRVESLRDVVAGTAPVRAAGDITLFKSVGLAIEDVAAGAAVLDLAERNGVGQPLPV
jgi:alanine dehydrogenase